MYCHIEPPSKNKAAAGYATAHILCGFP